jgi:Na+/phosphate symporter
MLSKERVKMEYFSFKDAFTNYFIAATIGVLISVAFKIIIFIIDPSKRNLLELTYKISVNMMKNLSSCIFVKRNYLK